MSKEHLSQMMSVSYQTKRSSHLCRQRAVLFDHFQLCIRKPGLPFAIEGKSKANEGSLFSNRYGCFIPHPVLCSLHHIFWREVPPH